jgi:hypothetical protein
MKERGKYQIQCMKSRSSTGVGQKIDLEYNIDTMRITDPGVDGDDGYNKKPTINIMDAIKARATTNSESTNTTTWEKPTGTPAWEKPMAQSIDTEKVSADVQSAKLKQLLNKVKST